MKLYLIYNINRVLISISNDIEYHVHAFLSVPKEASWRVLSQNGLRRQCNGECIVYDTVNFQIDYYSKPVVCKIL